MSSRGSPFGAVAGSAVSRRAAKGPAGRVT